MSLDIKLENFEGPLDLLLKLIDKNKIDIYNIPISKLTDDYLYYIKNSDLNKKDKNSNNSSNSKNSSNNNINNNNMEEISQFILMASTLLEIKSKMLLPKIIDEITKEDIDPREELVKKLIEYRKYKGVAEELAKVEIFPNRVIFKDAESIILNNCEALETKVNCAELAEIHADKGYKDDTSQVEELLEGVSLKELYRIFEDIVNKKELKKDKIRSEFKSVTKALYNIDDKMLYIKDLIYLNNKNNSILLSKIFQESTSRLEIVVTFLAMLELIKNREIKVIQESNFLEVELRLNGNKDNIDIKVDKDKN